MSLPAQHNIAVVLRDVAKRHHRQFQSTRGEDINWPEWYAEHMLDKVNFVLKTELNTIDLAHLLTLAFKQFRSKGLPEHEWAEYFAEYLVRRSA